MAKSKGMLAVFFSLLAALLFLLGGYCVLLASFTIAYGDGNTNGFPLYAGLAVLGFIGCGFTVWGAVEAAQAASRTSQKSAKFTDPELPAQPRQGDSSKAGEE